MPDYNVEVVWERAGTGGEPVILPATVCLDGTDSTEKRLEAFVGAVEHNEDDFPGDVADREVMAIRLVSFQ